MISSDTAYEDTIALLDDLKTIVSPHDIVSVNLESVVTTNPREPHPRLWFVFFTLPGSVAALADIGVTYASLGNNHIWDYLEGGLLDTMGHLDELGLAYSGVGLDIDDAYQPAMISTDHETDFAMYSWVASQPDGAPYSQHARSDKAGAASAANPERIAVALGTTADVADVVSIAHLHVGLEYSEAPLDVDPHQMVQTRIGYAVDGGADLVVGHHPHVAQGFEIRDGVLVAHSLGNLAFDQDRLDTRFGAMLVTTYDGSELREARVEPIHIADYRPTIALGEPADLMLRSWSFVGSEDLVLVPAGTGGVITARSDARMVERRVRVPLEVDAGGVAMLDVRGLRRPGSRWASSMGSTRRR